MKEIVLITGGHGMIASALTQMLQPTYEVRFLTRNKEKANDFTWDIKQDFIDKKALQQVDHIIHLSGANIATKAWSPERKNEIAESRVKAAQLLLKALKQENRQLKSFISASAIGYYGTQTSESILTETDHHGSDFMSEVVVAWEQAAERFSQEGVAQRVVKLRTGVVLAKEGGALPKMLIPITYYFGAPLGNGKHYMPWIHLEDICRMYLFALQHQDLKGPYNAVAPHPVRNKEFTFAVAKTLRKPIFMPGVPPFLIRLIFGERAEVILNGTRISAAKILQSGFKFKYGNLQAALQNLLGEK